MQIKLYSLPEKTYTVKSYLQSTVYATCLTLMLLNTCLQHQKIDMRIFLTTENW